MPGKRKADKTKDGQIALRLSPHDRIVLDALAGRLRAGRRAVLRRALREMFERECKTAERCERPAV